MKSTKALLMIALLSTSSASEISSEESNEQALYDGGRRASPVEECFCLVRHPMMVPVVDYLDSEGHGLSRLVVYLYKDKKTEQIHAYVPGIENQRKFPDISLDLYGNEIFVVNEELTVTSVFKKSKNVIPLAMPLKSPQSLIAPQEPAPDGAPDPESGISPNQLLIYDFSNGNIQTHTASPLKTNAHINTQSHPQIHINTHPQTHSHIDSQSYAPGPQIDTQTYTQSHLQSHPQITQSQPQHEINGASKSSSIGGKFHYVYNSVNADNKVNDIDSIPPSLNSHSSHHEKYQYPTPSLVVLPDNSFPTDTVPAELDTVETIPDNGGMIANEGSWSSSVPIPHSSSVGDDDAISAKRVSTAFEVWFKGQIKKVRDEQLTAHYVLDVKTLKANVEKILQENRIKLTANGKLQDSDGNTMSFSRLKLRPVLIGDSVGYEKVIHRHKFVFPKDLTYLEAILISVSYPPKILGLVPLRKVTLSQISQGVLQQTETLSKNFTSKSLTPFAVNVTTNKNNVGHDNTNPKLHELQTQTTLKTGIKSNKNEVETAEKENIIAFDSAHGPPSSADLEKIFGKPPSKVFKKNSSNKIKTTTEAVVVDGRKNLNSGETEERGDKEEKYNRNTVNIFKSLLSQTLSRLKNIFPSSLRRENVEKEEENSTEDPLGFRIIGGVPAIISGKMVNSRGRSGFIY